MNTRTLTAIVLAIASGLIATSGAWAQHIDILAYTQGGQIVIGKTDVMLGTVVESRIFTETVPGSDANGYASGNPGFNAITGYTLPGGVRPSLRAVTTSFLPRNLSYWDGTGAVSFGALPNNEKLYIGEFVSIFWQGTTVADGSASPTSAYSITTATNANGTYHKHISYLLRGKNQPISIAPGTGDDAPNAPPSAGFYIAAMELSTPTASPSVLASDPFFIIFNRGGSAASLNLAVAWLDAQLAGNIPEPASAAILFLGAAALLQRRRQHNAR